MEPACASLRVQICEAVRAAGATYLVADLEELFSAAGDAFDEALDGLLAHGTLALSHDGSQVSA